MGLSSCIDFFNDENNSQYTLQKTLIDHSESVPHESLKYILAQMENCICKIKFKGGYGTGFFCAIPFPDLNNLLPVLITNNHVLGKKDIKIGKEIIFTTNNEKNFYKISIDARRKVYTKEKPFDITIIELIKEYKNAIFLEIDEYLLNSNITTYDDVYNQKSIYLLHYPNGEKMEYSIGVIKNISLDNCDIQHYCATKDGSSGCPIINLSNYKVVGIHKAAMEIKNWNLGTLLKGPIEDFNKLYKNKNKEKISLKIFNTRNVESNQFGGEINNRQKQENNDYKSKINSLYEDNGGIYFKPGDKIISVLFMTIGSQDIINYTMACRTTDLFVTLEERLYRDFPKYRNVETFFMKNAKRILRFKTLEENKIKNNDIISLFVVE